MHGYIFSLFHIYFFLWLFIHLLLLFLFFHHIYFLNSLIFSFSHILFSRLVKFLVSLSHTTSLGSPHSPGQCLWLIPCLGDDHGASASVPDSGGQHPGAGRTAAAGGDAPRAGPQAGTGSGGQRGGVCWPQRLFRRLHYHLLGSGASPGKASSMGSDLCFNLIFHPFCCSITYL